MSFTKKKAVFCVLLAIIMVFSATLTVSANSYSAVKSATVNGYTYSFYSELVQDGSYVSARTCIYANDYPPAGYMAAQAFLCRIGSNAVEAATIPSYTSSATNFVSSNTYSTSKPGVYYAFGLCFFRASNVDNDYNTYWTEHSPYGSITNSIEEPTEMSIAVPAASSNMEVSTEAYQVNACADGTTYGTILARDSEGNLPDLIKVAGINGNIGYAYRTDLIIDNPDKEIVSTIPVYDLNNNVIDTFIIGNSDEED